MKKKYNFYRLFDALLLLHNKKMICEIKHTFRTKKNNIYRDIFDASLFRGCNFFFTHNITHGKMKKSKILNKNTIRNKFENKKKIENFFFFF